MAKCPNCGEKVARTEDWACPLCGYPLVSGSFKLLPKTYKQLKEEERESRLARLAEVMESQAEPEPEGELEPESQTEPEPQPEPVAQAEPESQTEPEPQPEPVAQAEPEPQTELEPPPEPVAQAEPQPVAAPEVVRGPDLKPLQAEIELTAEEMLAAYEANGADADARFAGKAIKVAGVVKRVEVKEMMDIQYITLASVEKERMQNIRCTFGREHADELNRLTPGQEVAVLGQYDGSIIDISLRNCSLA